MGLGRCDNEPLIYNCTPRSAGESLRALHRALDPSRPQFPPLYSGGQQRVPGVSSALGQKASRSRCPFRWQRSRRSAPERLRRGESRSQEIRAGGAHPQPRARRRRGRRLPPETRSRCARRCQHSWKVTPGRAGAGAAARCQMCTANSCPRLTRSAPGSGAPRTPRTPHTAHTGSLHPTGTVAAAWSGSGQPCPTPVARGRARTSTPGGYRAKGGTLPPLSSGRENQNPLGVGGRYTQRPSQHSLQVGAGARTPPARSRKQGHAWCSVYWLFPYSDWVLDPLLRWGLWPEGEGHAFHVPPRLGIPTAGWASCLGGAAAGSLGLLGFPTTPALRDPTPPQEHPVLHPETLGRLPGAPAAGG